MELDRLVRCDAHDRRVGIVPSEMTLMRVERVIGFHRCTVNRRRLMCQPIRLTGNIKSLFRLTVPRHNSMVGREKSHRETTNDDPFS